MANAQEPYFVEGMWWMDVDEDDHNFVVFNVTQDLTDRATTIASTGTPVELVLEGVTVLEGPDPQGSLIVALLTIDKTANIPKPSCTARVTCANGERFDRTINFNLEEH